MSNSFLDHYVLEEKVYLLKMVFFTLLRTWNIALYFKKIMVFANQSEIYMIYQLTLMGIIFLLVKVANRKILRKDSLVLT
jgi:hypothetical protein